MDHLLEISVRCSDQSEITCNLRITSDGAETTLLKHTKERLLN